MADEILLLDASQQVIHLMVAKNYRLERPNDALCAARVLGWWIGYTPQAARFLADGWTLCPDCIIENIRRNP